MICEAYSQMEENNLYILHVVGVLHTNGEKFTMGESG